MLRAQTLVTLKEYQSALFDVNRLLELNPSSDVYINLQVRLKTQLSLAPIPEEETELEETDEEDPCEEMLEGDEELEQIIEEEQKNDKLAGRAEEETNTASGSVEGAEPAVNTSNRSFTPESSDPNSNGWQAIPKPKGHSRLDYSRWDSVADGSSDDDDDDDEENQLQFRFRVKTVDISPVK